MTAVAARRSVMTLFSDPQSLRSHRVRMVLAEKNITVEIEDVDAIADATDRLLSDVGLRKRMADASREKVVTQHKLMHEAEAITAIYRELLAKP